MIVTRQTFDNTILHLGRTGGYGLDTETSGLEETDRLFSVIFADDAGAYYFNFLDYENLPEDYLLTSEHLKKLQLIFDNYDSTFFISNAKFDMRMLNYEGLSIEGTIHCILAAERVIYNAYGDGQYNLEKCAIRRGLPGKDDKVKEYLNANKFFTEENIPGKKRKVKKYQFNKAPFHLVSAYAEHDAILHYKIGVDQVRWLSEYSGQPRAPSHEIIYRNEQRLTKTCFRMERAGIRINRDYTERALKYEEDQVAQAKRDFRAATGIEFSDGRTCLVAAFTALGEKFPTTAKGNPSFTEAVLEQMTTPVAQMVNKIRKHSKRAATYYSSFLHYADDNDIIHADAVQYGAETGRFSYRDPNLQNVPKEDEEDDRQKPYWVRGCFMPREGTLFVPIDYEQQEYKMMLDYAGQMDLIEQVLAGKDLHQATADLVGVTRKQAKTLNFAILYGAGIDKLAVMLGITSFEAKILRDKYFSKLPKVKEFIKNVIKAGEQRGYIWNWAGRRCHITESGFAYILPNHIIQGGCADVVKMAMNRIDTFLIENHYKTRFLVQVHDELLFEVPYDELHIVPKLKELMESVYVPKNGLRLTASVDHSRKSWAYFDKVKGMP